ncbi:hypothetical protein Tco_1407923 [Tanacetum coccineum]
MKVKESLNVTFNETPPPRKTSTLEDDDLVEEEAIEVSKTRPLGNDLKDKSLENNEIINIKESKSHPLENVIEMLKTFGLEDSKPMKTPMSTETKLMKDEEGESVDNTKYRGMIGTTHLGLWYPKGSGIETIVYADSDYAGDYVDRKSTSGICTFMGCCLTFWFSKKQTALAISTTEAEYRKKLNYCNTSNEVDVNLPTPMSKPQSPLNEPSQENPPTTKTNHDSLQSHSLPLVRFLVDTNIGHTPILPPNFNQTQLTQPSFPHSLINPHVARMIHAQAPLSSQSDNQAQPPPPPSPSREMLINDINQLQDLSNLLAMHLS